MQQQIISSPRNVSIQLLRVIACLLVYIVHLGQRLELSGILRTVTDFGKSGVFLFFVISGFLAATSLCLRDRINKKEYYIKRAIAILPLYYFIILVVFIVEQTIHHFAPFIPADTTGLGWLRFVFLLNGAVNSSSLYWSNLAGTWTIPVFAFFYLIAPWVLSKLKTAKGAFCVWLGVFVLTKGIGRIYSCYISANLHFFFLGVLVYFCHRESREKLSLPFLVLCAVGGFVVSQVNLAYAFLFAAILTVVVRMKPLTLPTPVTAVVNTLDKYSFTLYLAHEALFHCVVDRLLEQGAHKALIAVVATVGTVAVTWLVGRFVEHPIQKDLRKRLLKKD